MPRHAKSKLRLIFPAKRMSEMESACPKMGEDVLYFDPSRANFETFTAGLSSALCLGNCPMCLYIDEA